jgi:hypothetical protein
MGSIKKRYTGVESALHGIRPANRQTFFVFLNSLPVSTSNQPFSLPQKLGLTSSMRLDNVLDPSSLPVAVTKGEFFVTLRLTSQPNREPLFGLFQREGGGIAYEKNR